MIWVHADCLSVANPAFQRCPGEKAVFVFDREEIEFEQWSLKRIAFLYETLLEMPVEIEQGDVVERLLSYNPTRIVTVESVNPRIQQQVQMLQQAVQVEVLPPIPFVDFKGSLDLKRFARYWKKIDPILFSK